MKKFIHSLGFIMLVVVLAVWFIVGRAAREIDVFEDEAIIWYRYPQHDSYPRRGRWCRRRRSRSAR